MGPRQPVRAIQSTSDNRGHVSSASLSKIPCSSRGIRAFRATAASSSLADLALTCVARSAPRSASAGVAGATGSSDLRPTSYPRGRPGVVVPVPLLAELAEVVVGRQGPRYRLPQEHHEFAKSRCHRGAKVEVALDDVAVRRARAAVVSKFMVRTADAEIAPPLARGAGRAEPRPRRVRAVPLREELAHRRAPRLGHHDEGVDGAVRVGAGRPRDRARRERRRAPTSWRDHPPIASTTIYAGGSPSHRTLGGSPVTA